MQILLLGSSLVAGTLGFDWIKSLKLKPENKNRTFHNYGLNGAQVPGVIKHLTTVPDTVKPDVVIVMVGGNDLVSSLLGKDSTGYNKMKEGRLGRPESTPELYFAELQELVSALHAKYGAATPIGICDIKPIGEGTGGKLNEVVALYNAQIGKLVEQCGSHVKCIRLNSKLAELVQQGQEAAKGAAVPLVGSDDILQIFNPSRMVQVMMYKSMGLWTLNQLGDARGFYCTCDGSHFNERSGVIVANEIQAFVDGLAAKP
ncbi:hypothetical protein HDV03_003972 [Kappamyces sp. JEL0829]|nr:hypothetical protein HDV03_003972 [Kappamyces sp. JEL0829]